MSQNINTICPLLLHEVSHRSNEEDATPIEPLSSTLPLFHTFDAYAKSEDYRRTIGYYSQMVSDKSGACAEKNKEQMKMRRELKKQEKSFDQLTRYMLYMDKNNLWDKNSGELADYQSSQFYLGAIEGDIPTKRQFQAIKKALSNRGFEMRSLTCKGPFYFQWRREAGSLGICRTDLKRLEAEHMQMKKELEELVKMVANLEAYMAETQSHSFNSDNSLGDLFCNQPAYFNPLDLLNEESSEI